MKRFFLLFSVFALIASLIGCGPVYKREYSFVAPKSNLSKMCTAQCVQGKNACQQNCRANNESCFARAHEDAIHEYEMYRRDRIREGKHVNKEVRDFDRSASCNSSCDCEPTYRACYSACGGQVLQRDVCVAFCDKK